MEEIKDYIWSLVNFLNAFRAASKTSLYMHVYGTNKNLYYLACIK